MPAQRTCSADSCICHAVVLLRVCCSIWDAMSLLFGIRQFSGPSFLASYGLFHAGTTIANIDMDSDISMLLLSATCKKTLQLSWMR